MSALELHGIDINQQSSVAFYTPGPSCKCRKEQILFTRDFSLSVHHEFIHKQRSSIR
jgi:hypothetical protein